MKILTRYIVLEFLQPFLLAVMGFSVIILVIQVFNDIHLILEFKPGLWVTFKYFLFQVPGFLSQAIPLAVLFGVLFSLSRLSKNSELIAMRAGGVSIFLVAVPLFFTGLAVSALSVLFNEAVVPASNHLTHRTKYLEILKQPEPSANKFRQNISIIGSENQIYHIGSFDGSTNAMTDVLILQFDNDTHLKSRIDAKTVKYEDGRWVFYDGYLRAFDDTDAEISAQPFDRMPIPLAEKPEDFLKEQKEPQEMNLAELYAYVHQLKRNGSDCHKELVELNRKIAMPFGCVILAILGIPWGWSMKKYSGVVVSFGVCLLVAFFYLGGLQIGQALGNSGVLSPFLSMWLMNMIFAVVGPVLLIRQNR